MNSQAFRAIAATSLIFIQLFHPVAAHAETYPDRAIRLIVPWSPGTPGDVAGRVVAERMGALLCKPMIVDNKPGASGTLGLSDVLRQPADGYTLYMLAAPATLISPLLYPRQHVDLQHSLTPVGLIAFNYNVLVTPLSRAFKTPADIASAAKARHGPTPSALPLAETERQHISRGSCFACKAVRPCCTCDTTSSPSPSAI